jgi:hypothetical protein
MKAVLEARENEISKQIEELKVMAATIAAKDTEIASQKTSYSTMEVAGNEDRDILIWIYVYLFIYIWLSRRLLYI